MSNRMTCLAGERIWKGDRVAVPLAGKHGAVLRVYGLDCPHREIGEALEDAEKGGLVIVAVDDGNKPLERGRTLTDLLKED